MPRGEYWRWINMERKHVDTCGRSATVDWPNCGGWGMWPETKKWLIMSCCSHTWTKLSGLAGVHNRTLAESRINTELWNVIIILSKPPQTASFNLRATLKWVALRKRRRLFQLTFVLHCVYRQGPEYMRDVRYKTEKSWSCTCVLHTNEPTCLLMVYHNICGHSINLLRLSIMVIATGILIDKFK